MLGRSLRWWLRWLVLLGVFLFLFALTGAVCRTSQTHASALNPGSAGDPVSLPKQGQAPDVPGNEHEPFVEPPPPQPQWPSWPPVSLDVGIEPAEAQPGDLVTVTVRLRPEGDLPAPRLVGLIAAGTAFEPSEGDGSRVEAGRVEWPLVALQRGRERELRFRLRMREDAPDLLVQRLQLWADGFEGPAHGEVVIKRSFPAAETRITPDEGGELRSADGRVRVVFPAGAVTTTVRVEHRPARVDRLPAGSGGRALEFELNAYSDDASATPIHEFGKPLELHVDLSGLVEWDALRYYQYPSLAYRTDDGEWHELMVHREGNALVGHRQ